MLLLFAVFIMFIPRMLNNGKKAGKSNNDFSLVFRFGLDIPRKEALGFLKDAIMANNSIMTLNEINIESVVKGLL